MRMHMHMHICTCMRMCTCTCMHSSSCIHALTPHACSMHTAREPTTHTARRTHVILTHANARRSRAARTPQYTACTPHAHRMHIACTSCTPHARRPHVVCTSHARCEHPARTPRARRAHAARTPALLVPFADARRSPGSPPAPPAQYAVAPPTLSRRSPPRL